MAETYPLPKWGLTMESGTLVEWVVAEGDKVEKGQILATVETDKVELEFESPASGYVARHLAAEGDEVEVGTDVVVIATDEGDLQSFLQ